MPELAVLLVNYNARPLLERCLERLLGQPIELLVIDNQSADGSRELLERLCPRHLLVPETNLGFAGALNLGLRRTRAPWLLSMNPDVLAAPDFFPTLLELLPRLPERVGMAAPTLRRISLEGFLSGQTDSFAHLDSTGLFLDRARRPYDRGQGQPDQGQFDEWPEILGPCGAAALYRRSMLEALAERDGEAFDESLFAYYEDVDLAWRARRAGFEALHLPAARVWHIRAGADSVRKKSYTPWQLRLAARAFANRYLVIAKNERPADLLRDLPWLLGYELARQLYLLLRQPRLWLQGSLLLLRGMRQALAKRAPRGLARGASLRQFISRPRASFPAGRGPEPPPARRR